MISRKYLTLFTVLAIILTNIVPSLSASKINQNTIKTLEPLEEYIIKDVPYVGQTTSFYCGLASITMLIQYFGFNSSLYEILHNSGYGYSFLYMRYFYGNRMPIGGLGVTSFSSSSFSFLADLYGLSYESWRAEKSLSAEEKWDEYWVRVKQNVSNNNPVETCVDRYSLPYLLPYNDILGPDVEMDHGSHMVVVVGFNESNETVCLNDPGPGICDDNTEGKYVFVSKDIFKDSIKNTTGAKYGIWSFKEKSGSEPLTRQERFETSAAQNKKRMKGRRNAYTDIYIPFSHFGINALKVYKKDLGVGITHRFLTLNKYYKEDINWLKYYFKMISIEKQDVSQYLLGNKNVSPSCEHDGTLLQKESNCWKNLTQIFTEFKNLSKNNNFLIFLIKSLPITIKMRQTLKEIISIEKQIIWDL